MMDDDHGVVECDYLEPSSIRSIDVFFLFIHHPCLISSYDSLRFTILAPLSNPKPTVVGDQGGGKRDKQWLS